jgi:hypothetical protein
MDDNRWFALLLCTGFAVAHVTLATGCGDGDSLDDDPSADAATPMPDGGSRAPSSEAQGGTVLVAIEGRETIASEEGTLALVSGTLHVEAVHLAGEGQDAQVLGPTTFDLGDDGQRAQLSTELPEGVYERVRVRLAPHNGGAALEAVVEGERGTVTFRFDEVLEDENLLVRPVVSDGSTMVALGLSIDLSLLGFYLQPFERSDGGVFSPATDAQCRGQFESNLLGLIRIEGSAAEP